MTPPKSIGFPRMQEEANEKRVFLPNFIQHIARLGVQVVLEEDYGGPLGLDFEEYCQGSLRVRSGPRQEVFNQDVVLIVRAPDDDFDRMPPGTILVSMLHYPTHPNRIPRFKALGLKPISLDSIVNDYGQRLVEYMEAVAWNGFEVTFDLLVKRWKTLEPPNDGSFKVLLLGTGMVGRHAVDAAVHLGNRTRNNLHIKKGGPGVICQAVGRNITYRPEKIIDLLKETDILVDATQRHQPSQPVIPNEWIQYLPEHAILVDLAVDPYIKSVDPPIVRGIEGIPKGNLDKYIFEPNDSDWEDTIPFGTSTEHRRTTVTCYSWPGFHPRDCMIRYGSQLRPLIRVLFNKGYEGLSLAGGYFERALYRGTLRGWEKTWKK